MLYPKRLRNIAGLVLTLPQGCTGSFWSSMYWKPLLSQRELPNSTLQHSVKAVGRILYTGALSEGLWQGQMKGIRLSGMRTSGGSTSSEVATVVLSMAARMLRSRTRLKAWLESLTPLLAQSAGIGPCLPVTLFKHEARTISITHTWLCMGQEIFLQLNQQLASKSIHGFDG